MSDDSWGALYVRSLGKHPDESSETYRGFMATRPPEVMANIALCLLHQAKIPPENLTVCFLGKAAA